MIDSGTGLSGSRRCALRDEPVDQRLGHVLDHREAAGAVAVERRVADRHLGLVAGRQHEPAELVRQRHQQVAADAGLEVLLGEVGLAACERLGEQLVVGPHRALRSAARAARRRGCPPASWRPSGCPRTSSATASSRTSRGPRRARRRRSGAPASSRCRRYSPITTCSKPFFVDVVARGRAPAPRRPPRRAPAAARQLAAGLGAHVALRRRAEAGERRHLAPGPRAPRARWRVSRSRADAAAPRVDVAEQQVLGELRRARDHVAVVVDARTSGRRRPARPGRRPARRTRPRPRCRARAGRPSARARAPLPRVVGRGGDVDDQRRAGERLVGHRRPGLPDVLADRQPDRARRRPR